MAYYKCKIYVLCLEFADKILTFDVLQKVAAAPIIVLSHWPHVAEQVVQPIAQLVASVKGLGHKLPTLLLNLCPSPFTLATCAATSCVLRRPRLYLDVTNGFTMLWNPMATAYSSVAAANRI